MKIAAIIMALFLVGCTGKDIVPIVQPRVESPKLPPSLRFCRTIPNAPPAGSTQADVAVYIIDLNDVSEECKRKLRAVVKIVDDFDEASP